MIYIFWFGLSFAVAMYARKRGRSEIGWFIGALFISPLLAWILLVCSADLRRESLEADARALQIATLQALQKQQTATAALAAQAAYIPPPGGISVVRYRIARGADVLGDYSPLELRRSLDAGELTGDDLYWDATAQSWLELVCHPMMRTT